MAKRTCSTEGCGEPHVARGFCSRCYKRARSSGLIEPLESWGVRRAVIDEGLRATGPGPCVVIPSVTRPSIELDGKWIGASRAVWILAHGDPGNRWVLHTCNNGQAGCVRLGHLYLGDHADNTRDKLVAERQSRGEQVASARLTEADVRAIRRRHPAEGYTTLGHAYGVWPSTIRDIVKRRTWSWL